MVKFKDIELHRVCIYQKKLTEKQIYEHRGSNRQKKLRTPSLGQIYLVPTKKIVFGLFGNDTSIYKSTQLRKMCRKTNIMYHFYRIHFIIEFIFVMNVYLIPVVGICQNFNWFKNLKICYASALHRTSEEKMAYPSILLASCTAPGFARFSLCCASRLCCLYYITYHKRWPIRGCP